MINAYYHGLWESNRSYAIQHNMTYIHLHPSDSVPFSILLAFVSLERIYEYASYTQQEYETMQFRLIRDLDHQNVESC